MDGIYNVSYNGFFKKDIGKEDCIQSCYLFKKRAMLDIRKNPFNHMVVDTWNGFGGRIITCNRVATFKTHISWWFEGYRD